MPTYSADVLPSQTGLNLGSASLKWNLFGNNVTVGGTLTLGATALSAVTGSGSIVLATSPTIVTPVIASIVNTGTLTLPSSTDTLVGRATTDTLTNKTLTAPVISSISNGGTLTLPSTTDTILGRATTDTLTNKTLTGTAAGNAVSLLNSQGPTGSLTGNSAVQTVYTYTIPANTVQASKGFRVSFAAAHNAGTAAVTWAVTLGGTNLASVAASGAGNNIQLEALCYNTTAQTAQTSRTIGWDGLATFINTFATPAENLANALALKVTFNVANTDQVTGKFFLVELIQ